MPVRRTATPTTARPARRRPYVAGSGMGVEMLIGPLTDTWSRNVFQVRPNMVTNLPVIPPGGERFLGAVKLDVSDSRRQPSRN